MSLDEGNRGLVVQRELMKAREAFEDIEILVRSNRWSGAANRLYYSVFHAVNALLVNDGHQSSRHNGSHTLFSQHYIKTGILPSDFGKLYNNLQTLREKSDYNCFFEVTQQDIIDGSEIALRLINAIEGLINTGK